MCVKFVSCASLWTLFLVRHWFGTVPFILLVPSFFRKQTKTKSTMADPARNPPSAKRSKLNKLPTSVSTMEAAQTVPPPNANPQQPQFVHYPLPTQQQQQQQNVVAPTPSSTPPNQLLHQQAQQMQQLPQVRLQSAVPSVVVTQSQYQVRIGDVWPFFDTHTATTLQTTHTQLDVFKMPLSLSFCPVLLSTYFLLHFYFELSALDTNVFLYVVY